jgi:RNA polymerase sigma factor (sigma-70 family)
MVHRYSQRHCCVQAGLMRGIGELLASLPEEERFILSMHYLKGMSVSDIANALGVPEKAVQSVITSGKSRLLSALNPGQ